MATKTGKPVSETYPNDLTIDQSSGVGVDATTRNVHDGLGQSTSISLSDDSFRVKPVNDNTVGTFQVTNSGGSPVLKVDTVNSKVRAGASQVAVNTQYAYFGGNWTDQAGFTADIHHAIPFNTGTPTSTAGTTMGSSTSSSFNDTNPSSSLTIAANAHLYTACYWHVRDNITIDEVTWLHGADTATGEAVVAHLMAYTVDTGNGSTSGDLSGGTVVADGATITNAGSEQIYYQSMTVQSADVDAGKVILFTFASDTINSDYSINATVKYHIR